MTPTWGIYKDKYGKSLICMSFKWGTFSTLRDFFLNWGIKLSIKKQPILTGTYHMGEQRIRRETCTFMQSHQRETCTFMQSHHRGKPAHSCSLTTEENLHIHAVSPQRETCTFMQSHQRGKPAHSCSLTTAIIVHTQLHIEQDPLRWPSKEALSHDDIRSIFSKHSSLYLHWESLAAQFCGVDGLFAQQRLEFCCIIQFYSFHQLLIILVPFWQLKL